MRAENPAVRIEVKIMIKKYFDVQEKIIKVRAKGRCSFCGRACGRKTTKVCTTVRETNMSGSSHRSVSRLLYCIRIINNYGSKMNEKYNFLF